MKKNSLVIDARMINNSGIGTYLKNILPEIINVFNVTLLGNKEELINFKWANKCQIIDFNSKIYSIHEQFKFPNLVPKADLLWCPHFNVPILPVKAKKIICTIHDLNHLSTVANRNSIKYVYAKMLYNNAVKKSENIITVSNFSKSELLKYTKAIEKRIKVIYCAVSNDFSLKRYTQSNLRLPNDYILYVGNVKPHKNLITLLKAYKNLPNEFTNIFKLVIVGRKDGFITSDKIIFRYIDRNNLWSNIYFTGYVSDYDIPLIYKNAKLFVFPSFYEGFGLPILEAMASKVPVISSYSASLIEIGGDASIYFNPNNPKELQQKLETLLKDDKIRDIYIKKGLANIKHFSWGKSSKEHIRLFTQIINSDN